MNTLEAKKRNPFLDVLAFEFPNTIKLSHRNLIQKPTAAAAKTDVIRQNIDLSIQKFFISII